MTACEKSVRARSVEGYYRFWPQAIRPTGGEAGTKVADLITSARADAEALGAEAEALMSAARVDADALMAAARAEGEALIGAARVEAE